MNSISNNSVYFIKKLMKRLQFNKTQIRNDAKLVSSIFFLFETTCDI